MLRTQWESSSISQEVSPVFDLFPFRVVSGLMILFCARNLAGVCSRKIYMQNVRANWKSEITTTLEFSKWYIKSLQMGHWTLNVDVLFTMCGTFVKFPNTRRHCVRYHNMHYEFANIYLTSMFILLETKILSSFKLTIGNTQRQWFTWKAHTHTSTCIFMEIYHGRRVNRKCTRRIVW